MGMIMSVVKFAYPAPGPEAIARKASEICGLTISYRSSEHGMKDVHEFSGELFFEAAPESKVEMHSYQQGAVKRFDEQLGLPDHPALGKTQGRDDIDGVQRVYLNTYFGCEMTLFHTVELALVKLDGTPERERDDLSAHDKILSLDELGARLQANKDQHRKNRPLYVLYGLFVIVTLPFTLLWSVISMPFSLFRLRRKHPELFKDPPQ